VVVVVVVVVDDPRRVAARAGALAAHRSLRSRSRLRAPLPVEFVAYPQMPEATSQVARGSQFS